MSSFTVFKTRYNRAILIPDSIGIYIKDLHDNIDIREFIDTVNKKAKQGIEGYREIVTQSNHLGKPTGWIYFKGV